MDTHETITQLNSAAVEFVPQRSLITSNQSITDRIVPIQAVTFPNNSTRQKSLNVKTTDPEKKEFLQTSVDSCRSTITQQESEIKRLNESLN